MLEECSDCGCLEPKHFEHQSAIVLQEGNTSGHLAYHEFLSDLFLELAIALSIKAPIRQHELDLAVETIVMFNFSPESFNIFPIINVTSPICTIADAIVDSCVVTHFIMYVFWQPPLCSVSIFVASYKRQTVASAVPDSAVLTENVLAKASGSTTKVHKAKVLTKVRILCEDKSKHGVDVGQLDGRSIHKHTIESSSSAFAKHFEGIAEATGILECCAWFHKRLGGFALGLRTLLGSRPQTSLDLRELCM
mmetsp:Transcript_31039/g.71529  ORF Transcript_31039/g.71529 Transcript_31039/m.71529 type:complete len:250 (+) Transcript_31039:440-1189(+)